MVPLLPDTHGMTTMGRLRACYLGFIVCIGGFLCKIKPQTSNVSGADGML